MHLPQNLPPRTSLTSHRYTWSPLCPQAAEAEAFTHHHLNEGTWGFPASETSLSPLTIYIELIYSLSFSCFSNQNIYIPKVPNKPHLLNDT